MTRLPTTLLFVVSAIMATLVTVMGPRPVPKSADDLWARALWTSLPPMGGSSAEMSRLFVAALDKAHQKAPIWVSFGDNASGAIRIKEAFDAALQTVLADVTKTVEQEMVDALAGVDPDHPDEAADLVLETLQRSYRKALDGSQAQEAVRDLQDLTGAKSETSIACYVAAVAEDPGYLPAWYRLAAYADGERQAIAIRELQKRDPRNAIGWYIAGIRAAESGNIDAALAAVETGNALPECRWYPSALPEQFTFVIPKTSAMRELGIAGRRLNHTGLKLFVRYFEGLFSWADPFSQGLRSRLCRDIWNEGLRSAAEGHHEQAVRRFIAIRELGLHFFRIEPRNGELIVSLLLYVRLANAAIRKSADATGNQEKRAAADELGRQFEQFSGLLSKAFERPEIPAAEQLRSFLGQRDLLAEDDQRLEFALQQSGFLIQQRTEPRMNANRRE